MNKFFLIALFLFAPFSLVVAQTTNKQEKKPLIFKIRKSISSENKVYFWPGFPMPDPNRIDTIDNGRAEVRSTFPGGYEAMKQFITRNLQYPEKQKKHAIKTKLYVSFVVDTSGQVINPKVLKNVLDKEFEDEAIRLMKSMPRWTPGRNEGKIVAVFDLLQIGFGLD